MQNNGKYINFINGKEQKKIFSICFLLFACFFIAMYAQVVHAASKSVLVTIDVKQSFNKVGSSAKVNDEFSYELVSLNEENPMPAESVGNVYKFKVSGTTAYKLGTIEFLEAGVYLYELKNIPPTNKPAQYTYDGEVYTIRITVKQESDSLLATISINNSEDKKKDTIPFAHKYQPLPSDAKVMVDPPVKKTVIGTPSTKGVFTFTLTAKPEFNPMPAGSKDGVKTMSIVGSGKVEFGTWAYTEEGTYEYVIAEENTGEASYRYDRMSYKIIDVVKDVDGTLKVYRTIENNNKKQVKSLTFVNEYKEPPSRTTIGSPQTPKTGDDTSVFMHTLILIVATILALISTAILCTRKSRHRNINIEPRWN